MQEKIELVDGKFVVVGKQERREPIKLFEQPPAVKEYSKEALELRERVIKGNQKLFDAWQVICKIDHESQQWKDELEKWHQATAKLSILCSNLQGLGYWDCLYLEGERRLKNCLQNPDGFFCLSCPSRYPYWEKDAKVILFEEKEEK